MAPIHTQSEPAEISVLARLVYGNNDSRRQVRDFRGADREEGCSPGEDRRAQCEHAQCPPFDLSQPDLLCWGRYQW